MVMSSEKAKSGFRIQVFWTQISDHKPSPSHSAHTHTHTHTHTRTTHGHTCIWLPWKAGCISLHTSWHCHLLPLLLFPFFSLSSLCLFLQHVHFTLLPLSLLLLFPWKCMGHFSHRKHLFWNSHRSIFYIEQPPYSESWLYFLKLFFKAHLVENMTSPKALRCGLGLIEKQTPWHDVICNMNWDLIWSKKKIQSQAWDSFDLQLPGFFIVSPCHTLRELFFSPLKSHLLLQDPKINENKQHFLSGAILVFIWAGAK